MKDMPSIREPKTALGGNRRPRIALLRSLWDIDLSRRKSSMELDGETLFQMFRKMPVYGSQIEEQTREGREAVRNSL
jgi:hypothetical protein